MRHFGLLIALLAGMASAANEQVLFEGKCATTDRYGEYRFLMQVTSRMADLDVKVHRYLKRVYENNIANCSSELFLAEVISGPESKVSTKRRELIGGYRKAQQRYFSGTLTARDLKN